MKGSTVMPSAAQVAQSRADRLVVHEYLRDSNQIPPITDPMGRSWNQPATAEILIDSTHAVMERSTFERLAEYSATQPSGCYPGKMWRRHDGLFDAAFRAKGGVPEWLLCWYGYSEKGPDYCSINFRSILLVEAVRA